MKRTFIFSIIFLVFFRIAFSQEKANTSFFRNQIGFQLNPVINDRLLSTGGLSIIETVSALRYGYRLTKNVTTGLEFACGFPININAGQFQYFKYFSYKVGFYTRYSFLAERRFQLFAEFSPYYSHSRREWTSTIDHSPYTISKFGYYAAPGLSLYSKSRRISLDMYYKFSNLMLMNRNKSVFSYKVNYNF